MVRIEIADGVLLRRAGNPDGPKLICLHGFCDSGAVFAPLFDTPLARDFELVALDLPGFGASPPLAEAQTVDAHGVLARRLADRIAGDKAFGLIGHSIGSASAVAAARETNDNLLGLFSIEGNLCEEDAYFTGRAVKFETAEAFKAKCVEDIWNAAQRRPILRRYYAGIEQADADAMWALGKDAVRISENNAVGKAYAALDLPKLYFWSTANTPEHTQTFIAENRLANIEIPDVSHFPMVDATEQTGDAIARFFLGLMR